MARGTMKLSWIGNQKARQAALKKRINGLKKKTTELGILCDTSACLTIYNPEEDELVVWPSPEEAKSLIDRFFSLPDYKRNIRAVNPESFIKKFIQKTEKKLADSRKAIEEFEMEHLMFELQIGRELADLSQAEVDKLISYSEKKIMCSRKQLDSTEQLHASVNEASVGDDETLRASNVVSGRAGNGFNAMETGSIYNMNQWLFDDPEVQKHCDETHLPTTVTGLDLNVEPSVSTGLDLNVEPSNVDEDMGTYKGESSKGGGTEDNAE